MEERAVQKLIGMIGMLLAGGAVLWFGSKVLDVRGLDGISIQPRKSNHSVSGGTSSQSDPRRTDQIRIASFNIQVFGEQKLANRNVMKALADVVRHFDVVAIQEVRSKGQGVLPQFVDEINATGRHYDYAIGPRQGRTNSKEQYAFVYDTQTIELDRHSLYVVDDPDDLLHRPPFVGGFRVRGPPTDQAFTFTLVNIHTDPDESKAECDVLADVFEAVRNDGRHEDDIIILGDLNADDQHLGRLGAVPHLVTAIYGIPSNTRGTHLYDNIVFDGKATVEFAGRAGVDDLMQQYNLSMEDALEVSDHFPVWAEFNIYEGGEPGRLAARTTRRTR